MNTNSNATIKKLIQVTEEAQAPIHMPILLGNECFIVTQQDVRRIEDTRLLSYSKVSASGELIPLDVLSHDGQAILTACRCRMQMEQNTNSANGAANSDANAALAELFVRACGGGKLLTMEAAAVGGAAQAQQQTAATATAATVEQQLQWAKATNNTSAPYPLTYTSGTSTSEIPATRTVRFQQESGGGAKCCCCSCCCCRSNSCNSCAHRGCNTMDVDVDEATHRDTTDGKSGNGSSGCLCARAQLKQKKMKQTC